VQGRVRAPRHRLSRGEDACAPSESGRGDLLDAATLCEEWRPDRVQIERLVRSGGAAERKETSTSCLVCHVTDQHRYTSHISSATSHTSVSASHISIATSQTNVVTSKNVFCSALKQTARQVFTLCLSILTLWIVSCCVTDEHCYIAKQPCHVTDQHYRVTDPDYCSREERFWNFTDPYRFETLRKFPRPDRQLGKIDVTESPSLQIKLTTYRHSDLESNLFRLLFYLPWIAQTPAFKTCVWSDTKMLVFTFFGLVSLYVTS